MPNPQNVNTNPAAVLAAWSRPVPNGCHEWQGYLSNTGYGNFEVAGERWLAHRAAFQLYVGPIPTDLCVLHACDNRRCVNPEHLFLGTKADNTRDMLRKGRHRHGKIPCGEDAYNAKLTNAQAREILALAGKLTRKELKARFGVSKSTIQRILTGGRYAD